VFCNTRQVFVLSDLYDSGLFVVVVTSGDRVVAPEYLQQQQQQQLAFLWQQG